jgi:hypothetical protein
VQRHTRQGSDGGAAKTTSSLSEVGPVPLSQHHLLSRSELPDTANGNHHHLPLHLSTRQQEQPPPLAPNLLLVSNGDVNHLKNQLLGLGMTRRSFAVKFSD